ncbi:SDR family NAD(P)-dependent oxidoreductase [Streptomyces phaeochromogenes]|uniref:SDR family NAD(P)-dependent oxidoreductase n=1 Tax=Streptomyces phaeochromogenes TaxID=1923 RepID=UPI002DDC0E6D|nr:SDR family oxidoreductase [Streptomyces phaeochromogenes]WRZ34591.1 SDR family oxidoreductase [Streptomyces phaeochromogenes]
MTDLQGKTALVTGASRGIGRGIAQRLAQDGALVAVHYGTNEAAAKDVVASISEAGGRAFAIGAELGKDGDVENLFTQLEEGLRKHTGETALDIVVNNAGIGSTGSVEEATAEDFDHVFAVNAKAPLFIIQRALPLMGDGGRIINISSGVTRIAFPGAISYAMTKGALDVLGRTLAKQLGARNITVNNVAVGFIATDATAPLMEDPETGAWLSSVAALGRVGHPADMADIVAFLASDDARYITGALIDATGGGQL